MLISDYLRNLREKVGNDLLLVPSVGGVIFDEEGRMLLARHHAGGVWVTPGGAIDPGETPADAVVREVWEETGLHVEPLRIVGVHGGDDTHRVEYDNGDVVIYVGTFFECRIVNGTPRADGEEILALRYVSRDELAELPLAPWAQIVLPNLFDRAADPFFTPPTWLPPDR